MIIVISDIENVKQKLDEMRAVNTITLSSDEVIEILSNDPRIKRISATDDVLEIYTVPIILNLDDYNDISDRIKSRVDERHKKLNFGEYVILIKPGFMPVAFPYNVDEYNIPPMYRKYTLDSIDHRIFDKGFSTGSESSDYNISALYIYNWITSPVGKQLGCYRRDASNSSYTYLYALYPHPHVNWYGSLCYGNMRNALYDAIATNSVNFIVNLTLDVLFGYNNESPYYYLWVQRACAGCPDIDSNACNACECKDCNNADRNKCVGCSNFRQPSLSSLFCIQKTILSVYVHNRSIPRSERISKLRGEIDAFIEERTFFDPDVDVSHI